MIPFALADVLCDRILAFMVDCDRGYLNKLQDLTRIVLNAIATRQFVIRIDKEGIRYFACYWMVNDEEIENLLHASPEDRVFPTDTTSGNNFYLVEFGSRNVKGDIYEAVRKLRIKAGSQTKHVYWHRTKHGNRLTTFPYCKHKEDHHGQ